LDEDVRAARILLVCGLGFLAACGGSASPARTSPVAAAGSGRTSSPAPAPVSQLFAPAAAWFATTARGWSVGTVPCQSGGTTLCVTMVRTSDGGQGWTTMTPPPFLDLADPYHHAVLRMTAAGDGLLSDGRPGGPLWSTHDGGSTWHRLTLPGAAADAEVDAIALGENVAYVVVGNRAGQRLFDGPVGGSTLRATGPALVGTDGAVDLATAGGRTWVLSSPGLPGQLPRLWRTVNGSTWTATPIPCTAGSTGRIAATDSAHVVLGCQDEPSGPNANKGLFTSPDGGLTFTPHAHLAPDGYLQSIAAPSTSVVVAALSSDNDLLVRSGDGASTFVVSFASQIAGEGQGLYDLGFPDSSHGFVVLGNSGAYAVAVASGGQGVPPPRLLTTGDAGGHWTQLSIGR
jgi:photosystem II stability/assembly factor-like uncharacterized protein